MHYILYAHAPVRHTGQVTADSDAHAHALTARHVIDRCSLIICVGWVLTYNSALREIGKAQVSARCWLAFIVPISECAVIRYDTCTFGGLIPGTPLMLGFPVPLRGPLGVGNLSTAFAAAFAAAFSAAALSAAAFAAAFSAAAFSAADGSATALRVTPFTVRWMTN